MAEFQNNGVFFMPNHWTVRIRSWSSRGASARLYFSLCFGLCWNFCLHSHFCAVLLALTIIMQMTQFVMWFFQALAFNQLFFIAVVRLMLWLQRRESVNLKIYLRLWGSPCTLHFEGRNWDDGGQVMKWGEERQFLLRLFFLNYVWSGSAELVRLEGQEYIPDFELMQIRSLFTWKKTEIKGATIISEQLKDGFAPCQVFTAKLWFLL